MEAWPADVACCRVRWAEWDWTSREHQADELADWLYGQLDADDKRKTKKGPPEVGGCCAVQ